MMGGRMMAGFGGWGYRQAPTASQGYYSWPAPGPAQDGLGAHG